MHCRPYPIQGGTLVASNRLVALTRKLYLPRRWGTADSLSISLWFHPRPFLFYPHSEILDSALSLFRCLRVPRLVASRQHLSGAALPLPDHFCRLLLPRVPYLLTPGPCTSLDPMCAAAISQLQSLLTSVCSRTGAVVV